MSHTTVTQSQPIPMPREAHLLKRNERDRRFFAYLNRDKITVQSYLKVRNRPHLTHLLNFQIIKPERARGHS